MKPQEVWIIGAGKFGARALRLLRRRWPQKRFCLVDVDAVALKGVLAAGVRTVIAEGIDFVCTNLGSHLPEWIVPAIPSHLAFGWLRAELGRAGWWRPLPVPVECWPLLPNPRPTAGGGVCASYANWHCPEDCTEPRRCPVSGEARPLPLFRLIAAAGAGFTVAVIRSHQLAPGVGGYRAEALFRARSYLLAGGPRLLIATACKCHGIVHALDWEGEQAAVGEYLRQQDAHGSRVF